MNTILTADERNRIIDSMGWSLDAQERGDMHRLIQAVLAKLAQQEPVAWVIPGKDNADAKGWIDAKAWEEDEFTQPLYHHPSPQQADRQRVPQWRPIETAPKDATAILVMRDIWPGTKSGRAEECNGHNTYVAQWWGGEKNGAGAWICYMDAVCDPECPIEPTHWMPLPAPPAARESLAQKVQA